MISPDYLEDRFMDTFGSIAFVLENCGIYLSVFLFFKLIIDVLFMVIRHLEKTKMTGASLGFGKTLLSAAYNIFFKSVLTSMYDPHAPTLAAVEEERKNLCISEELHDMRDDTQKKEELLCPVMSAAQFNQAVTRLSLFQFFFRQPYTRHFLFVTVVFQSFPTQKKISNPLRLLVFLVWMSRLTLSSLSYPLSLVPRKYPLIQLRLTRRPLQRYRRLVSLQL